ncbi:MAG: hypothetical protein RIR52_1752, partial [Acidobacteriota bacterium]
RRAVRRFIVEHLAIVEHFAVDYDQRLKYTTGDPDWDESGASLVPSGSVKVSLTGKILRQDK